MSLIADSLKKAVKEKSSPKWDPGQEINLLGKRNPLKHPGLWSVFRIGLLIILPTAILAYLIATGAFDFNNRQTPPPQETAKAPFDSRVSPKNLDEKILKASPQEVLEKPLVEEAVVLEKTAVLPEAPRSPKKIETVTKKVLPYPPRKQIIKESERAIEVPEEGLASLPSPVSKPEISEAPKTPLKVPEQEVLKVVPPEVPAIGQGEEAVVLEKKAVVPEVPPALVPEEAKISKPEIEKVLEVPGKPVEEERGSVSRPESAAKSLVEETAVVERKAVVPESSPALKPVEEKIPQPEIAKVLETPSKPVEEEMGKVLPPRPGISEIVSVEKEEKSPDLTIEVQKDKRASLPSPVSKPEITRTDPSRQENIFQNSDFYFNRAVFFQQAKDWQKALDNYVKAEKQDPNNPDTYNNKGVIFKELGQYDRAIDEFLRAIFLNPQYAKAYNNIGVVYFMQKNYAEGVRNYLKAIDLNPRNLEAFNNLAIIYKKQKDLEKARAVLNRALAMDPDHPGTNYNLAVLYEENKEITPALHYYRRFIELGTIGYPALVTQVKKHVETLKPQ